MKTLKVELTQELDDGRKVVKTLTGEDAAKWQRWVDQVCLLAWNHRTNPPWGELNWREREIDNQSGGSSRSLPTDTAAG
jgi:hypothetical protein